MCENAKFIAADIVSKLRNLGIKCDLDIMSRSIKSQMKYANKMNYDFAVVIGNDELNKKILNLKNMSDGTETSFNLDNFHNDIYNYLKLKFNY